MRLLIRRLSARIGIRNRGVAVVRCPGATVVMLRVGFRPFPESAHFTVYEDAHARLSSSERFCVFLIEVGGRNRRSSGIVPSLEGLIGRECHNHQDNKNRYDKGWNKPGGHGCCPFAKTSSVVPTGAVLRRFTALQSPAKRFAFESCAGVK
jgi:hypothetical protein